jgi:hypothetical protein
LSRWASSSSTRRPGLQFRAGALVFFAALTFVGLQEKGLPFWAALPATRR